MGRYRRMSKQEEIHFKRHRDKLEAVKDINDRREVEGNQHNEIPYYLQGRRREVQTAPLYNNGRLIRNQWGQMRKYLDWELADLQSNNVFNTISSFNEWKETQ
mgnify:CR=1 FL=1